MPTISPFRPLFAVGETVGLGLAVLGLYASWTRIPGEALRPQDIDDVKGAVTTGTDAFGVSLSAVWSPQVNPVQPRLGAVLLVVAVAALVAAWLPAVRHLRTVRMAALLVAAGLAVAVIARATRAGAFDVLGPGAFLTAAAFLAAAVFASGILRLPVLISLAIVLVGGGAALGWFVAGRPGV